MSIEERVAKIEGVLEQIDKRLSELREDFNRKLEDFDRRLAEFREDFNRRLEEFDERLTEFREYVLSRLNSLDTRLNHLESEVRSMFRWTIGLIIGIWATMITLLLPIALKILGII